MVAPALLFYGGFPLGYHNREAERKAVAFSAAGYDVLYVRGVGVRDPRLRAVAKAASLVAEGLRRPAPSSELLPETRSTELRAAGLLVVPPRRMRAVRRLNGRWLERQLRRHMPDPARSVAWIRSPTPELVDVLPRLSPAVTVYECVDAVDLIPELAESSWLTTFQAAERKLVELADAVVTPSPALAERFGNVAREVHVVPHGVDLFPWSPRSHESGQPVVLGFVGSLDFRIDMPVLRALATARPAWHIRLMGVVGPGFDATPVRDLPNVTIESRVDPQRLGEVLAGFDIGLMPYIDYPGYHYSNAVKNLELLAAGRPAVARPAPALAAFADALYFAATPDEFIAQCDRALAEDSLERAHARRGIAERHTWDDRLAELLALLEELRSRHVTP